MSAISNLGYICIVARDLDAWESFATGILGAVAQRAADGALLIRLDELEYRLQILPGEEDDLAVAGWAIDTVQELEDFVASLRAMNVTVHESSEGDREARMVERLYWCIDPDGLRHEFFTGARYATVSRVFASPLLVGGGFETGRLGVGHYLQNARDVATTVAFYEQVLGLKISDYIREKDYLPGLNVEGTFLRARTGRHHSAAVTSMPTPKRVHHIMVQLKSLDDVGLGHDRCIDAGIPIQHSLGHHPNDKMTSFYVTTPSGFALEYGWGAIVVDDDDWEIKTYSELSDWGHRTAVGPDL
jgi:2,3-dihydroxybiphenyl 1,2-dioxygenase